MLKALVTEQLIKKKYLCVVFVLKLYIHILGTSKTYFTPYEKEIVPSL